MTFILKYSGADRDYFIETLNKPLKPYEFIVAKFECKNEDIKQAKLDLFNTLVRRGLIRDSSNKNHLITCNRDDFRFYILNQYHHDMFSKEKQMNELYMSMESDDSDNDESTDELVSQNVSNNQISKFFVDSRLSIKTVPTTKTRKTNTDELLAYLSKNSDDSDDSDEYSNDENEDEEEDEDETVFEDEEINSTKTRRNIKMTVSKKINSLTDDGNDGNEDNEDSDEYSNEEDEEGETFDDEDLLS